eukprot:jgi/Mesvir1/24848/Mv22084-RA.1
MDLAFVSSRACRRLFCDGEPPAQLGVNWRSGRASCPQALWIPRACASLSPPHTKANAAAGYALHSSQLPSTAARRDRFRDTRKHTSGRPTPEQLALNGRIMEMRTGDAVMDLVERAWRDGVALNGVNMVTAVTCIARVSQGRGLITRVGAFKQLLEAIWAELRERPGSFGPREVANLAHGLAKLAKLDKVEAAVTRGLDTLEGEILRRGLSCFNPQHIANTLWAYATAGRGSRRLYSAVQALILSRGLASFKPQEIANTAWAFATSGYSDPALFAVVESEVLRVSLRAFNAQGISNTLWAFATAGYTREGLYAAVEREISTRQLSEFTPQGIANIVWSFATAGRGGEALFGSIDAEVSRRGLSGFNPQEVSNLVWAFAKAGRGGDKVYGVVEAELNHRGLSSFNPQGLSNIAWAFATAGRGGEQLYSAIQEAAVSRKLQGFRAQNIANLVWAFAVSGRRADSLYDAVESALAWHTSGPADRTPFNLQELSNVLWSFAVVGRPPSPLSRSLLAYAASRHVAPGMPLENLSQLAQYVLACVDLPAAVTEEETQNGTLVSAVMEDSSQCGARLASGTEGDARHVSSVAQDGSERGARLASGTEGSRVGAMATAVTGEEDRGEGSTGKARREGLGAVAAEAVSRTRAGLGRHASSGASLASSSAMNGEEGGRPPTASVQLEAVTHRGQSWAMASVTGPETTNSSGTATSSFATTEHLSSSAASNSHVAMDHTLGTAAGPSPRGGDPSDGSPRVDARAARVVQLSGGPVHGDLLQLQLLSGSIAGLNGDAGSGGNALSGCDPVTLGAAARIVHALSEASKGGRLLPMSSRLHLSVSRVLSEMGIAHENERPIVGGLYYVDCVVRGTQGPIAVEVDGPSHFRVGPDGGFTVTSSTALKQRMLAKRGWQICSVPYFEWDRLGTGEEKKGYLAGKLRACGYQGEEVGSESKVARREEL